MAKKIKLKRKTIMEIKMCFRVHYTPCYNERPIVDEGEIFDEIYVVAEDAEEAFQKIKEKLIGEELDLSAYEHELENDNLVKLEDTILTCTNIIFYSAEIVCQVDIE